MIPKIFHYCWFGPNRISNNIKRNINTWHTLCPDYKIIKWSEKNFDVYSNPFTKEAYKEHNWAFVSDYVRLLALKIFGGIYLDTDVKVVKSFTPLLNNKMFIGLENWDSIASGLALGSTPNNKNIINLLNIYNSLGHTQSKLNKHKDNTVKIITDYFRSKGFKYRNVTQYINNCTIFPTSYFCPQNRITGKTNITKHTYSIHYYYNSWTGKVVNKKRIRNMRLGNFLKRIIRPKLYDYLYNLYLSHNNRNW